MAGNDGQTPGTGWAEGHFHDPPANPSAPIDPPPPPPRNPAPYSAPPVPSDGAPVPFAAPVTPPYPVAPPSFPPPAPVPSGGGSRRTVLVALGAVLAIGLGVVGGAWWVGRDDADETDPPVLAQETSPGPRETSVPEDPEEAATSEEPTTEETQDPAPAITSLDDPTADSRYRNRHGVSEVSSSADISQVHVVPPRDGEPGWLVVQLSEQEPGVAVILRIDTDGDGWPDLTAWQHTATGASGSFPVTDWSHGRDIVLRRGERDHHFAADGYRSPMSGTAFALDLAPDELPDQSLVLNIQTLNDDMYYDYFPLRQRWKRVPFEVAP